MGFKNAVNTRGLCGFNDWRLPTADELQSIVDYGVAYPDSTIDTIWFPNIPQGEAGFIPFLSASPYVGNSNWAWVIGFNLGYVSHSSRYGSNPVRLVRAGQPPTLPAIPCPPTGDSVEKLVVKNIVVR